MATTVTSYTKAEIDLLLASTAAADSPVLGLAGGAIDVTGTQPSTAAVQALFNSCPDGATVVVPSGAVIILDGTITITKRITLTGGGELRWTAGIGNSSMIDVRADGCVFDRVYLTNPNHLAAQTGNRTHGIRFQANYGVVTNSRIVGQQAAICVEADGEWHHFTFAGNHIVDVPGAGTGTDNDPNDGMDPYEDRGDGIVCWGALATITGNTVTALAGTDARIGIHTEGLATTAATVYVHGNSMVTITGNIVTGKFRRSISCESVTNTVIANNTVADATWWALSFINTSGCVIADNTILWTRTAADTQGAAYNPERTAIMAYGSGANNRITGNTITVAAGAALSTLVSGQTAGTGSQDDLVVAENSLVAGACATGISLNGGNGAYNRPRIAGNKLAGFASYGVYLYGCGDLAVTGNRLDGVTNAHAATAVYAEGGGTGAKVEGNWITWVDTGVRMFNRNALIAVNSNTIYQANTGVDLYGCAGATVNSNLFNTVTTKTANLPTGATAIGNN